MAAIPLEELGQQRVGGRPAVPGTTLATVHFVGDHHLLVTFPIRRLMKRLPDSQPEDDDRLIEAVLVDLPSGKVAARTTWRVHDAGQYLWDLGHGQFMLRLRDHLLAVSPLQHLAAADPFEEKRMLTYERRTILGVLVSAESDLLTVETTERPEKTAGATPAKPKRGPVEISFYRIERVGESVAAATAGTLLSQEAIEIPMTHDGYLDISQESRGRWLFDYIAHAGKKTELSPFDTSCYPRAKFVSRAEFVAFGCRGSADKIEIGGFDMRGEEMWQQNFFESFVHPTFAFAPEVGRFALGRSILPAPAGALGLDADSAADQFTGEDVSVYQTHTGRQIFHTVITPVQRTGQNFALSQDGLDVAVVRGTVVEVYRLPVLSEKERREIKGEREMAFEEATGPIRLPTRSRVAMARPLPVPTAAEAAAAEPLPVPVAAPKEEAPVAPRPPIVTIVNLGDAPPNDEPRKAPTLYGTGEASSPDEKPTAH